MKKLLVTLGIITLVACGGNTPTYIKNDTTIKTSDTTLVDTSKLDTLK